MRYAAFVSYSHRDRPWAEWLHRKIEGYRPPKALSADVAGSLSPLRPVFIDRAELPSSTDLAASVRTALEESAALIVICSIAAAQSRWVNEEVRAFKALGRAGRIFCFVVDGEPRTGECFPPALRYEVEDGVVTDKPAAEPLAADVRPGKDDRASAQLKIIAALLGVPLDRLRQRELARRHRRLVLIAAASATGCVAFGAISVVALRARAEAERQSLTARRTADFMKSLFAVSDPSEARGNSITAREVLDRGVRQVESQLKDTPLVRADLTTTLGEVYANLGLYQESMKLLDDAARTPDRTPELTARTSVAIAELQVQRGDYPAASSALAEATRSIESTSTPDEVLRMRVLAAFGDMYQSTDDEPQARKYFAQLLTAASRPKAGDPNMRIHALEGIAQADLDAERFDAAEAGLKQALAEQIAATGEIHPRASELLNELGSLEYLRGRRDLAIPYYRRCLDIDRQIFGTRHPATAASQNNLARMLLEERDFTEADTLLQESLATSAASVAQDSDAMTFRFANLALVRMGVGELASAEPLFHKALKAAVINKHRLHGPILTDLADLECRTGRYTEGLARLDEARPIVAERYPHDPWRLAHLDNVRAGCLTGDRRYGEAEPLIASSMPVLLTKWPPDTLYGYDAVQRSLRLYRLTGDQPKLTQYRLLAQSKDAGPSPR
jgi:tetratricopeptide (TPR) repeat protein